jgi:uroporphyrinogen decarboxylase
VEEVVNEVKLRLRSMGKGGGMILAPAHAIQPETPLENILAFYETAKTHGQYPLRED